MYSNEGHNDNYHNQYYRTKHPYNRHIKHLELLFVTGPVVLQPITCNFHSFDYNDIDDKAL